MKRDIADRWIAALRSGKFHQGKEYLHQGDEYCCLGVLCELAVADGAIERWSETNDDNIAIYGLEEDNSNAALPAAVLDWAGMKSERLAISVEIPCDDPEYDPVEYESFAGLNDEAEYSFEQIARLIDEQADQL